MPSLEEAGNHGVFWEKAGSNVGEGFSLLSLRCGMAPHCLLVVPGLGTAFFSVRYIPFFKGTFCSFPIFFRVFGDL